MNITCKAAANNKVKSLEALIKTSADLDKQDRSGNSALILGII